MQSYPTEITRVDNQLSRRPPKEERRFYPSAGHGAGSRLAKFDVRLRKEKQIERLRYELEAGKVRRASRPVAV